MRFAEGPLASHEIEVSGLLHDIQYQGSATRYELKLENGQTLSISQANNQWLDSSAQHQTGQRHQRALGAGSDDPAARHRGERGVT